MGVPAQTTGHHAKSIYLTQFSTAGQHLVASSGCEINVLSGAECEVDGRVEVRSGGELELESGSTMNVEAGGTVNFTSGSVLNRGDFTLTTGLATGKSTLPAYGITVLKSTRAETYELSHPTRGAWKKIIFVPSSGEHTVKVKVDSATKAGWTVHIGSTKVAFGRPTVINFKSSGEEAWLKGGSIELLGVSTNLWLVAGLHCSSQIAYLSLTTST